MEILIHPKKKRKNPAYSSEGLGKMIKNNMLKNGALPGFCGRHQVLWQVLTVL